MFYIVGFSLGGQTAGYAGSYLKEKARMTLGRITGNETQFQNLAEPF